MTGRINQTVAALVIEGLKRTAAAPLLAQTDLSWLIDAEDAGVPLAPYRATLAAAFERYGPAPILQSGASIRGVAHPILFVLLNTADPEVLIEKEARLNRFIHSRHRVEIIERAAHRLVLRHVSDREDPRPTENLAGCGQHIVLLEEIGCRGLKLKFPQSAQPERYVYDGGRFTSIHARAGFQIWHFEWERFAPARRPMEGLDEMLLQTMRARELREAAQPVADVESVLLSDLGRTWKLSAVAQRLGRSARTLQRQLAGVEHSFSAIVLSVRTAEAARLLKESDLSVTEIGYVCGFADTAHFSRSFKQRYGATPGAWQRAQQVAR